MNKRILVINPGSTSTKIAVYNNQKKEYLKNINHPKDFLLNFKSVADQFDYRKKIIIEDLQCAGIDIHDFAIIAGRGGLLKPITGGVYKVNEKMLSDIKNPMGEHASNLGGMIAYSIAKETGKDIPAIIVDPECIDEFEEIARISGMPEIPRKSFVHALNQKAIARTFSKEINQNYEEINLIIAHMGGGISVGAHCRGKIIDVNNALDGDGPFTPERCGGIPAGQLVELCFSGKYPKEKILKILKNQGGLYAYLGTGDAIKIENMIINGDENAELVYDAMIYQIAKEIGAMSTVLKGVVHGILLTGGLAHSSIITDKLIERVKHLGQIKIYAGEGELEALAMNALMVLNNEIEVKEYV